MKTQNRNEQTNNNQKKEEMKQEVIEIRKETERCSNIDRPGDCHSK